jgi:hypothetical protein
MDNPDRFLDPRGNQSEIRLEWEKTHHLTAGPRPRPRKLEPRTPPGHGHGTRTPRLRGRQHVALTLQGSSAHQELPMSLTCRRPRR